MIELTCKICGKLFLVTPCRATKAHYCSRSCVGKANGPRMLGNKFRVGLVPVNSFTPGHSPWNKDLKGIHLSPATEIKRGIPLVPPVPIGTERTRPDKKGKPRVWVKVSDPNGWRMRAQVVWESSNGMKIPPGHLVHHKNRVSTDDSETNLVLLSRAEHINEHRSEFEAKRNASNLKAQKLRRERRCASHQERFGKRKGEQLLIGQDVT